MTKLDFKIKRECVTHSDFSNPKYVYIGRPMAQYHGSPLQNPFVLHSEDEREKILKKYEKFLDHHVLIQTAHICNELKRLYRKIKRYGEIILVCYCNVNQHCHGDCIKNKIIQLNNEDYFK